jgi:radical SAM-linked protein
MPAAFFPILANCGLWQKKADGLALNMNKQEQLTRIRVEYTKAESLRFTGHLDVQRLWERLLRRSKLPIRYSQGFHPRARLNLASALPLGFVSESELLDFWMDEAQPLPLVHSRLAAVAPPGIEIKNIHTIDLSEASLQSQMHASEFTIRFFDPQSFNLLEEIVQSQLSETTLVRTRRKKTYDLRPLILKMAVVQIDNDEWGLSMLLSAEPGKTGRPDEVMDALGFNIIDYLVCRKNIVIQNN